MFAQVEDKNVGVFFGTGCRSIEPMIQSATTSHGTLVDYPPSRKKDFMRSNYSSCKVKCNN